MNKLEYNQYIGVTGFGALSIIRYSKGHNILELDLFSYSNDMIGDNLWGLLSIPCDLVNKYSCEVSVSYGGDNEESSYWMQPYVV
jgi:hypothetical protein